MKFKKGNPAQRGRKRLLVIRILRRISRLATPGHKQPRKWICRTVEERRRFWRVVQQHERAIRLSRIKREGFRWAP